MDDYAANLLVWKIYYVEKSKTKKHIKDVNMKLFYLFTAQCSPQCFTKIKSLDKFDGLEAKQNGIRLLRLIQEVVGGVEKHIQDTWALVIADKALHAFYQWPYMPNNEYIKLSNSRVTVLETLGVPLPIHSKLINAKLELMGCKDIE